MGWTYTWKEKNTSMREFFANEFADHVEILDFAVVKLRTAYVALKNKNTGSVHACVILLDYVKDDYVHNIGFKYMDESVHPYYYECPKRILDLLTPTDYDLANKWRSECRKLIEKRSNAPKIKDGDTIRFSSPIEFTNGKKLQEFIVRKEGRKINFVRGFAVYSIRNWKDRDYEIVKL